HPGGRRPPGPETTADPALRLLVGARAVAPVSVVQGRHMFLVPRADTALRLVSRSAVLTDTAPWVCDNRRLGVMLGGLTVRSGALVLPIPLDHPAFGAGWWQPEWHGPMALRRWTNGDALVPMPDVALAAPGPCLLEIEIADTVRYPLPATNPSNMNAVTQLGDVQRMAAWKVSSLDRGVKPPWRSGRDAIIS